MPNFNPDRKDLLNNTTIFLFLLFGIILSGNVIWKYSPFNVKEVTTQQSKEPYKQTYYHVTLYAENGTIAREWHNLKSFALVEGDLVLDEGKTYIKGTWIVEQENQIELQYQLFPSYTPLYTQPDKKKNLMKYGSWY